MSSSTIVRGCLAGVLLSIAPISSAFAGGSSAFAGSSSTFAGGSVAFANGSAAFAKIPAAFAEEPAKPAPKPGDAETAIATLVPADTICIIKVTSLDAFGAAIQAVTKAVKPEMKDAPELDVLLSGIFEFPGSIALIDHKKPLAVCFTLDPMRVQPMPTYILPVTSKDEFLKSLPTPPDTAKPEGAHKAAAPAAPVVVGDYVGISKLVKYAAAEKPRAIAEKLAPGIVSTRIDLERLFELTRPMIEPLLGQLEEQIASAPSSGTVPGLDMKALAQSYMDGFRTFMDSAETLDLAASTQGDRIDATFAFTALEKSALADYGSKEQSGVETLAKFIDPDASVSFVLGMDVATMMKKLEPLIAATMASYPEPMRGSFATMMTSFAPVYPLFGPGLAMSFDFSPNGMRGATYFRPKDAKALLEAYTKCLKEMKMPGLVLQGPEPVTVDGFALTKFQMSFDAKALAGLTGDKADASTTDQMNAMIKKLYGENGIRVAYGIKDDAMVQVIGGDDAYLHRALATLKDGGRKLSREQESLLGEIKGSNPCYVARIDLATIMTQVMDFAAKASEDKAAAKPKATAPAPITFFGGIDGRVWHGGASWDMARVATSMKSAIESSSAGAKISAASGGKAKADIVSIESALKEYALMNGGKYPDSLAVLVVADSNGHKYLEGKTVPKDPWGREYMYDVPSSAHPEPRVYSYGRDGKPGGEGEDADIDNESVRKAEDK